MSVVGCTHATAREGSADSGPPGDGRRGLQLDNRHTGDDTASAQSPVVHFGFAPGLAVSPRLVVRRAFLARLLHQWRLVTYECWNVRKIRLSKRLGLPGPPVLARVVLSDKGPGGCGCASAFLTRRPSY